MSHLYSTWGMKSTFFSKKENYVVYYLENSMNLSEDIFLPSNSQDYNEGELSDMMYITSTS
jgi:hypothetical protein